MNVSPHDDPASGQDHAASPDACLVRVAFPATGRERLVRELRVGLRDASRADAPDTVLVEVEVGPVVVPAAGSVVEVSVPVARAADLPADDVRVYALAGSALPDVVAGDFLSTTAVRLPSALVVDLPLTWLPLTDA